MNTIQRSIACLLIFCAAGRTRGADTNTVPVTPLINGDRIIFLGDSLTEHGQRPEGFIPLVQEAIREQLRDKQIEVIGAGKGWDKVSGLRERFDRDVVPKKPTIVVVEIGINDLCQPHSGRKMTRQIFQMGMEDLVWRIQRLKARPILTSLTVAGERPAFTNKYDHLIEQYSQIVRDVAKQKKVQLIECREPFKAYIRKHNTRDKHEGCLTTDGAHFNEQGNRLFANLMLQGLGLSALPDAPPSPPEKPPGEPE